MNASKENAKKAFQRLSKIMDACHNRVTGLIDDFEEIQAFLVVAERKLPTEEAFRREKSRRRKAVTA